MSDIKDHDPDEGEWLDFNLMVGSIQVDPSPILPASHRNGYKPVEVFVAPNPVYFVEMSIQELCDFLDERAAQLDDNPNLVRGYN